MFEGSESSELKRDEFIADGSNPRIRIKWVKGLLAFFLNAGTKTSPLKIEHIMAISQEVCVSSNGCARWLGGWFGARWWFNFGADTSLSAV